MALENTTYVFTNNANHDCHLAHVYKLPMLPGYFLSTSWFDPFHCLPLTCAVLEDARNMGCSSFLVIGAGLGDGHRPVLLS